MVPQLSPVSLRGETAEQVERFKRPGLSAAAVIEARCKGIEALAEANRIALAGAQGVAQKHGHILYKALHELQSLVQRRDSSG